jgi:PAS domain S-box-containing protein
VPRASEPRPAVRETLQTALGAELSAFREQVRGLLATHDLTAAAEIRRRLETEPAQPSFDGWGGVDARVRPLAWQAWVLDRAPLGVTLTGPAYHDNPLRYANVAFRELTGYDAARLSGVNPRLLQTETTERERIADFVEALRTWEPVTVELDNERADGTPFRNRVSLVPVAGDDGTVEHWFGVQAAVAWPEGRPDDEG